MTYRYQLETNSSTKTCSYVTLSLTTLPTSNLFTCQLVNSSTRTKTFLCYFVFNYPAYKQLVHLSTRTKTLCLNKRIYIYIIRRQKSVKFNYFQQSPYLSQNELMPCNGKVTNLSYHSTTFWLNVHYETTKSKEKKLRTN